MPGIAWYLWIEPEALNSAEVCGIIRSNNRSFLRKTGKEYGAGGDILCGKGISFGMIIRKASMEDWEEIRKIYAGARRFMAEHGNAGQWGTDHPREELLLDNIAQGKLYVCMEKDICPEDTESRIGAVFYYAAEEDPTYRIIEDGEWLNDKPYAVVHRIASAGIVKGAASFCLDWAFRQTGNLRIDTHKDNIPMQKLLHKNGFSRCGKIYLENGESRMAFQKAKSL